MEFVDHDIALVWRDPDGGRADGNLLAGLYRGDAVRVEGRARGRTEVSLEDGQRGWVRSDLRTRESGLLELAFIDVGQGDACLITAPNRTRVLVDGGENQMAARYLAKRFWHLTERGLDVHFDALVATHGDADHIEGLSTLVLDAARDSREGKRIRVTASRVFHNGLCKRSSSAAKGAELGPVRMTDDGSVIPLVEDPRTVQDTNKHFQRWATAIDELGRRCGVDVRRLDHTSRDAFAFLDDVAVDVVAPRTRKLDDGTWGVPTCPRGGSLSPALTMNEHSITLRVSFGRFAALLAGDLHAGTQSELVRLHDAGELVLRSQLLKVPHHGSADGSAAFIRAVEPLISVVSAGDEDARRDHLHPRANVIGLLGGAERGADPVVFVTNLAAFDRYVGPSFRARTGRDGEWEPDTSAPWFYARQRTAFGIVHVRSDGDRVLTVRRGARPSRFEAYSYTIAEDGSARSLAVDRV